MFINVHHKSAMKHFFAFKLRQMWCWRVTWPVHFQCRLCIVFGWWRRRNIFYKTSKRKMSQSFLTGNKGSQTVANVMLVNLARRDFTQITYYMLHTATNGKTCQSQLYLVYVCLNVCTCMSVMCLRMDWQLCLWCHYTLQYPKFLMEKF